MIDFRSDRKGQHLASIQGEEAGARSQHEHLFVHWLLVLQLAHYCHSRSCVERFFDSFGRRLSCASPQYLTFPG